jgi:hypothetical protein
MQRVRLAPRCTGQAMEHVRVVMSPICGAPGSGIEPSSQPSGNTGL